LTKQALGFVEKGGNPWEVVGHGIEGKRSVYSSRAGGEKGDCGQQSCLRRSTSNIQPSKVSVPRWLNMGRGMFAASRHPSFIATASASLLPKPQNKIHQPSHAP
jgi:hypothetical protein